MTKGTAREVTGERTSRVRDPGSSVVSLIDDELYAVGGVYPMDGRVSWVPEGPGFHPTNSYVLRRDDGYVIVDPGLRCIEDEVLSGLRELIPPGSQVSILITRPQLDCAGNVGKVFDLYPGSRICTTLAANYFDCFDDLLAATQNGKARGAVLGRPEASGLEVMNPVLHLIRTVWAYDAKSATLFTSDSFSHGVVDSPSHLPVIDEDSDDPTTVEDVLGNLLATHHWMPSAPTKAIIKDIETTFHRFDVEIIAPDRGSVLVGKPVVERHLDLMISALEMAEEMQ